MDNKIIKDFFLGFIKIHILYHTSKRPFYGQELKDELEEHGYTMSYGTLYPILHRLCSEGCIEKEEINVEGKIRKYYSATERGKEILEHAKIRIREMVDEVMEQQY